MPFYPVNLQIAGRPCAVLGGGAVARRKAESLLAAGAEVTVFSPKLTPRLAELAGNRQLLHVDRPYRQGDLQGFFIVICATDNPEVNQSAAEEARCRGALVNVVDSPELGDFNVPAQVVQGDLLLTVSTGGKSPALARRLRQELSERYGMEYGIYLTLIAKVRQEMKQRLATAKQREYFWRETIDENVLDLLRQGRIEEAEAGIRHAIGCIGTES
ncbi:MAG: bifunctional precorrin-2 dehydrogenase/sirohydrochlorin ferrochelatase [Veillonellales bacterium]